MQFLATLLVSAAALISAQTIDPGTIPAATKASWCVSQQTQCPLLCTQINGGSAATYYNTCDSDSLSFSCVCGNGLSPNSTEYSQTIPYFECTESNNRCVANCGNGNSACAAACRDNNPCGASDPKRYNITTTASTMSATGAVTSSAASSLPTAGLLSINGNSGDGNIQTQTDSQPKDTSAAKALAADMGRLYGTVVVTGSIFLGFTAML